MNLRQQIRKHEDLAEWFAARGFSKRSAAHTIRASQLKTTLKIKRECRTYRQFDDSVNGNPIIEIDDCTEVYGNAAE